MNASNSKSNSLYIIGLVAIFIEFILYLAARKFFFQEFNSNDRMIFVFSNHAITISYLLTILIHSLVKNRWRFLRMDKRLFIAFITLAYISAHTLNEEIAIFSRYPMWLNVLLISVFVCLHLLDYLKKLPEFIRLIIFLVLGFGSAVILYFSIYLAPFVLIGIVGLFFFGLTIYLFTPLIVLITIIYQFFKNRFLKTDNISFMVGMFLPIIITIVFLFRWNYTTNRVAALKTEINKTNQEMPDWLILGQHLPTDDFTRKFLSSELAYDQIDNFWRWSNNLSNTLSENVTHDPLITITKLFFGDLQIEPETCLKIIEFQYDARHEVYQKLWTGRDLETKKVNSTIEVYPEFRLAFTELIITVANNNPLEWSQQEALYTFTLPEGSVVSSMSLWINGKEEKSHLTTKAKADSAYTTIVGSEKRDPALLHWQEGNTITIKVFPCTNKEDRIFKIGVTSTLKYADNQLILGNIQFKGPNSLWADEISTIKFITDNKLDLDMPRQFNQSGTNEYVYKGLYIDEKIIKMKASKLSAAGFTFNDKTYKINELQYSNVKFNPSSIYLDINKSWTNDDFEKLLQLFARRQLFVFDENFIQLNEQNRFELFNKLNDLNFSIFPFHKVPDPSNSLVISKSTSNSPNLNDLNETKFGTDLEDFLRNRKTTVKLVNIGSNLSPYLKSLKEYKTFDYYKTNFEGLEKIIKQQLFPVIALAENQVVLDVSKARIEKQNGSAKSGGPDHLMRLYAYNKIMELTGNKYFNANRLEQDSLISIANEAYIVSPVSSLVVLETVQDYERFDIPENTNSLENAVKNSSGSIPEPHEWALIILVMLVVGFLYFKR